MNQTYQQKIKTTDFEFLVFVSINGHNNQINLYFDLFL